MKNKILLIAVAVLIIGMAFFINAQSNQNELIPESEISVAVESFTKLLEKSNPKDFDLESAEQLRSLKTGYQFLGNMIGLEDIRNFKEGTDPNSIIKKLDNTQVFLVNDAGKIITGIAFTKEKEKSVVSGFGLNPSGISLKRASEIIGDEKLRSGRLVDIPSLGLSFIASQTDSTFDFISIMDAESEGLRVGTVTPASKLIQSLIPIANEYNGLPR